MKQELDNRSERGISVNLRSVYGSFLARLRALFGAGVSLGFVLFVAITSAAVMNRGSNFAWASWQQMWDEEMPKQTREIMIPEMPSTRKAQPFRPQVMVQQRSFVTTQKPVDDYRNAQERRLLLSDLWSRFNQTLNTARSFSR
ncbi:MAG: hypothetical protein Q8P45_01140 [Candidatus Harrisonbacteria bacterium]|nr:hypothetical protein [Candidatus Harrisonbacteria bacterium]